MTEVTEIVHLFSLIFEDMNEQRVILYLTLQSGNRTTLPVPYIEYRESRVQHF